MTSTLCVLSLVCLAAVLRGKAQELICRPSEQQLSLIHTDNSPRLTEQNMLPWFSPHCNNNVHDSLDYFRLHSTFFECKKYNLSTSVSLKVSTNLMYSDVE